MVRFDDFDNTVALFANEYQVPLLPSYFAALSATFFELTCSVLLALGLAARLATLPLIAMTAVIQFTYFQHMEHLYWVTLLVTLLSCGAGKFSLDYLIKNKGAKSLAVVLPAPPARPWRMIFTWINCAKKQPNPKRWWRLHR
jgi:uncharacterized membrane protein YphA (DoxX/SURF4 family)